tara:strand:- start:427 stop:822 length:396 start_codon:yes stop_codon:yes gene_type:complete
MKNNRWKDVLLGLTPVPSSSYRIRDNTLYRRNHWVYVKGSRIKAWAPVLKVDGEDWIGYNYSAKDFATHLLQNEGMFAFRYVNLRWVEIGRGIGGRGTSSEWNFTRNNSEILTKMINPTLDMLLPLDAFEN